MAKKNASCVENITFDAIVEIAVLDDSILDMVSGGGGVGTKPA